jgi:hypothetical protein
VSLTSLWLPILLSAIGVFVASSLIHMVIGWHRSEYGKLPREDDVLAALRDAGVAPGEYAFPNCTDPKQAATPEMKGKFEAGPVGFATILPNGLPSMGRSLVSWFVYTLVVGVLVAYVTSRTLDADAHYLQVFRVAGTVAFLIYAGAEPAYSIWKGRPWSSTVKGMADGLIYGLVTAGVFGWLWS